MEEKDTEENGEVKEEKKTYKKHDKKQYENENWMKQGKRKNEPL